MSNVKLHIKAFISNINIIIKIKDAFSKLFPNKVLEIYNVTSNSNQRSKPKVNITTKELSRKQIIILISLDNIERVIVQFNIHMLNINCSLKDIKLEICTNFICSNNREIIKVASALDMNTIEKIYKEMKL